jgi:Tol biopolymer transport system component
MKKMTEELKQTGNADVRSIPTMIVPTPTCARIPMTPVVWKVAAAALVVVSNFALVSARLPAGKLGAPLSGEGVLLFFSDRGGGGNWDIFSVLPNGTALAQLTRTAGRNADAILSSDGRRIAFTSNRSGASEIWVMGHDGSSPTQLTHAEGGGSGPDWSPAGDRIAFNSSRDGGGIFSMASDGSDVRRISPKGLGASGPSWSPDGMRIAFTSGEESHSHVWVMGADGSNPVRLTTERGPGNEHPEWSPDGQWIAFNSWRNREASSDIWIIRADGSEERRLTSGPEMEEYPRWSPDGTRILFTVGNAALFTMAADGSDRRQVTEPRFFTAGADWGRTPGRPIR